MTDFICTLPYAEDGLEPLMDTQTVVNHRKHHQKYNDNLTKLLKSIDIDEDLDTLLLRYKDTNQQSLVWDPIYNNAAQVHNHNLFFLQLTDDQPKTRLTDRTLVDMIKNKYGSVAELKKQIKHTVTTFFGSGWVWVTLEHTKQWDAPAIFIHKTPNGGTFVNSESDPHQIEPIMIIDVWEHAYYLQHQMDKASYFDNVWKLMNWDVVEQRFSDAMSKTFDYTKSFEH